MTNNPLPEYLSFDAYAGVYDETRATDAVGLDAALDWVASRYPRAAYPAVLEPGVGTGRIAAPLARKGFQVTGVDVSPKMLAVARRRTQGLPVRCCIADAARMPFRDAQFDLAVVTHFFHLVREWRAVVGELLRVLRRGPVIILQTGCGSEIPALNTRYKDACADAGHPIQSIGAAATTDVVNDFVARGCTAESIEGRWRWSNEVKAETALDHLRRRLYSFTNFTPAPVHDAVIEQLERELLRDHGSLQTPLLVENEIKAFVLSR